MSRTIYFRPCHLVRLVQRTQFRQRSWIPEKYAVVGKVLRLRDEEGWQDGWVVESVGAFRVADDDLPDPHHDIKRHRRATGDSLPRETRE